MFYHVTVLNLDNIKWLRSHKSIILWLIAAIALALRLIPLLSPEARLLRHVPDDAFYLYRIAENLATRGFLSFDSVMPTTTARPLYIILLAGLRMIVGHGGLPIASFALGALADCLGILLIWRLLKRWNLSFSALCWGTALYAFSIRTILFTVNGMETPWANLLVLIALNLYPINPLEISSEFKTSIARGVLYGLIMLMRLDYVFIVGALLLYEAWSGVRSRRYYWVVSGLSAFLVILPWILWSYQNFGSVMPPSGDALVMTLGVNPTAGFDGLRIRLETILDTVSDMFPLLFPKYQYWLGMGAGTAFIILAIHLGKTQKSEPIPQALKASFIGLSALAVYFGAIRLFWREWNLVLGDIMFALIIANVISLLSQMKQRFIAYSLLASWLIGANMSVLVPNLDGISPGQERMYKAALWIKDNTNPDDIIAACNGGIIAWYGERTVVDAAGIEDIEAYKALKSRDMYGYIKSRGAVYLVDPEDWVFLFYRDYWGTNIESKVTRLYEPPLNGEEKTLFDPTIYRLE